MNDVNVWNQWGTVFNESFKALGWNLVQFVPELVVAVVLFIVGWVLGNMIAKAFEHTFSALKVDKLLESIGGGDFFRSAGMNLNSGYFIGQLVKWFVIVVFLIPSLELVGLGSIKEFLQNDVLGFLPKVILAALVLVIATFVAEGLSKTVKASAKTMSLSSAGMLSALAKYSVWVFAFIFALGQLGLNDYMQALFGGLIQMFSLGAALAFGLGAKDTVAKFLSKVSDEVSHRD
ncbi:hypothetical protein HZA26_01395 [Candidatus Nomurabacteria bacterium]|nr:hypothetical protein [Candidatus Nomurabacteria bacterium]